MKPLLIVAFALSAAFIVAILPAYSFPAGTSQEAFTSYSGSTSQNSSAISFSGQRNVSQAPAVVTIGKGYYGSHPVSFSSAIGSETWIKNTNDAASLNHEVSYAHGVDGAIELSGQESSFRQGDYYSQSTGTINMKISEDVTEGMVHFGGLQGSGASSDGESARDSPDPLMNAWKTPSLEMEEDYIGSYHIEKNMTIATSRKDDWGIDYWLDCCSGGILSVDGHLPPIISTDDVFNSRFLRP